MNTNIFTLRGDKHDTNSAIHTKNIGVLTVYLCIAVFKSLPRLFENPGKRQTLRGGLYCTEIVSKDS